jgi:hypothetical protein
MPHQADPPALSSERQDLRNDSRQEPNFFAPLKRALAF